MDDKITLSSKEIFEAALALEQSKDNDNIKIAEKLYLKVLETNSDNYVSLYRLGRIYDVNYHKYPTAEKYYLKSVKFDHPFVTIAYYHLGNLNLADERKKAEKYYLKALELNDKNDDKIKLDEKEIGDIMNNLGYVYEKLGNYTKAEEYHNKAIEHKNYRSYSYLGGLYYDKENYTQALIYYEKYKKFCEENNEYCEVLPGIEKCKEFIKGNKKLEKIYTDISTGSCSICADSFLGTSGGIDIFVCGHAFHKKCIKKWTEENDKHEKEHRCPECREEID
jgi:tetratricopeptide (TPR) repeat protein